MSPIWRMLYWMYRMVSGSRHWLRRRLTAPGWMVLGGFCAALLMGIDTENTVAYQGFPILLFLLVIAVVFSWFFRARFSATRLLPRFGTVGRPFYYQAQVRNLTPKTQVGITLLENFADPRPTFREWRAMQIADERRVRSFKFNQRRRITTFRLATVKEAELPAIASRGEAQVRVEVTPLRRGILRFTGMMLARTDPIGLFRAFVRVPVEQAVLILPKRYVLPPVALPGTMKYQEGGVALASSIGRSEEFVSLRDYRRGDPYRHIHWRSWAKAGKPIVKEFEDQFFVRHALVLDTFVDDPYSDAFEEAVAVAASFACTLITQESLLDLLFVGAQAYCFTAGRGLAHADQMLEILASVRATPETAAFDRLETLVLEHATVVSGCICVLLAWDPPRRRLVEKLRALGVPVLVLLVLEPGEAAPDAGPLRNEPEQFRVLEVGKVEEQLAKLAL